MRRPGDLIDVTVPVKPDMPQWDSEDYLATSVLAQTPDDDVNVTLLTTTTHTGTHVDAPRHFIHGGTTIDQVPLDRWVGPCVLLDFTHLEADISSEDLDGASIPSDATRLVFKTRNSEIWRTHPTGFFDGFVALAPSGAEWLVDHGVRLVGIDYLSIGAVEQSGTETHRVLLGNDIVVVEGLDLTDVSAGPYELLCFPLKLAGADGAPARVALRVPSA